jgi:hypothetical protein
VDLAGKNGRNLVFYQVWFQTISQSGFAWTLIDEDMFCYSFFLFEQMS